MKALLVSPVFHGYWQPIRSGLVQNGWETECVLYDELLSVAAKTHNKLLLDLPEQLGADRSGPRRRRATARVARGLAATRPDLVVVVKGDIVDVNVFDETRQRGAPVVLWLYDELMRLTYGEEDLRSFDHIVTYSRVDQAAMVAKGISADLLHNAFDDSLQPSNSGPDAAAVFIGARYPNRSQLMEELVRRGIPVRAYGREWSHRFYDRARTLQWVRPDVPGFPDVARPEAGELMHRALAVLNIHIKGTQDGFNMRTFEACGMSGLQCVDRPDVAEVYEPGREVLIFGGVEELAEQIDHARRDPVWSDAIRLNGRRRTLAEHTFRHRCRELLSLC